MIPWSASIRVHWTTPHPAGLHATAPRTHRIRLWIPLFLVWLLLLPLVLVLFPFVALAGIFVRVNALRLYSAVWSILNSLRHTLVEVHSPAANVRVHLA
ncbi:MAG TPA: hypothetical protein VME86_15155 [Acidobacteriaceae bacterium]|nr:hypothetical protein [Acidobacteriaceae bacterium]